MGELTTLFQNFRLQDVFDIVIIAGMIAILLIWFKDRASRFVFSGVVLLGFLYGAARFFHLYLTTVILQGFFGILAFALVVIFQEDLRRFLERLALWGRLRKPWREPVAHEETAEILALTAASLARNHIGALIVLTGSDPLDRHLSGGTRLNGLLSQPLLESLFDPHSAGHDGAVIVDGSRVVRFGCHLPLSTGPGKNQPMGLRHTAALGLAERSDAVCIVVSEERGTISLARGEQLQVLPHAAALKSALSAFYAARMPVRSAHPFWQRLKTNPREKAIAILLACVLWLVFGYQRDSVRRDFLVPVEYVNVAADWIVENPKIPEATIMVMGPSQAFQFLDVGSLKISLDLSRLREGRQEIPLTRNMVRVPANLTVLDIKPNRLALSASRLVPVSVPVRVTTEHLPPPGYAVERITVSPQAVTILIPSKRRADRIAIRTAPVNLQRLRETRTVEVKLAPPPDVQLAPDTAATVRVTVRIAGQDAT